MAATSTTPNCSTSGNNPPPDSISKSYFQKTVCLKDWWLLKADDDCGGNRLAVAGITSREKQAARVFFSAPILRRHDVFTLETVDNICIIFKGFLDKTRTEENGFPSEVCDHFVFGFPPYWETYARNCFGGEPLTKGAAPSITDSGGLLPQKVIAPEVSERVPSLRDSVAENMKTLKTSGNSPGNIPRKPFVSSVSEENDVYLSEQNNINDPQKDMDSRSLQILSNSSACQRKIHLSPSLGKEIKDYCLSSKAFEEPTKVGTRNKLSEEMEFRNDLGSANDVANDIEGSRSKRSLSDMLNPSGHVVQSDPQSSSLATRVSGCEENATCHNVKDSSASCNSSLPIAGLQNLGDDMIVKTPDSRSTDDDSAQKQRTSYTDEGMNGDQSNKRLRSKARKSNIALCSSSGVGKAGNGRTKNNAGASEENIFQHTDCCGKKPRKTYETRASRKEKDESIISPEYLSLNRSKSGRLLLPTLEYWRNQRAIYAADRQIMGIRDLQVNELSEGSRSEPQPQLKRRNLR